MPNLFLGIAVLFVSVVIYSAVTQKLKLFIVSSFITISYLLLLIMVDTYAKKETDISIIPTTQAVAKLNSTTESSNNVEYHTSDTTYVKKTEYRVSKDSPFHLLKGDNVVDTKYDIYLEK